MHNDQTGRMTRREVLAAGLAAAGAAAIGTTSTRAADSPPAGPFGPFKMGIQSYSLRAFSLEDALNKTHELGLKYWESFNAHIPADPKKVGTIKPMLAREGVQVIGYGVVHFSKDHDANRKLFDFAKSMGVEYLSADPELDSFESLDKLVEEYGIPVGIHNHGPGHKYAKIDAIEKAIKDHHEKIGCCIDTGHFLRSKEDPVRAAEVFGKRIYGVHLKDVKDAQTFTILGKGDLRTADLLKELARLKYNYCLALEYEENEKAPMDDLKACVAAEKKAAAGL